ncbi:MAG: helix-turn-helix domain-containing protein [Planctomycetota bacterium]
MSANESVPETTTATEKAWYTVREAAAYLGVSEPTIFRWMKDKTLSFYKIGGGTRFAKEGLDAVIEKTTGESEARAASGRCASCGHGVLVAGRVQGTGRLYFRPETTKFWVWAEPLVSLSARVCAACGYVQLHADTEKLTKLGTGE